MTMSVAEAAPPRFGGPSTEPHSAAPLSKLTFHPKFVCTLINIRMRNLVGVACGYAWRSGS